MQVDSTTVWTDCLDIIRDHVGEQSFATWFKPIRPISFENNTLTLHVPSRYFYEWLEEHYIHILKKAIIEVIGKDAKLAYTLRKSDEPSPSNNATIPPKSNSNGLSQKKEREYSSPFDIPQIGILNQNSQLNPNYVFDNFVEGDCNRLAKSAGIAVANKPGVTSFNPLMFYGGVGLGKTHLVQAIGNSIKDKLRDKFALYVSSEKFTNQFIDALKNNKIQEFQNFYMQVDVLILDDVQFLAGKEKTQEMFFHIFNHLHQLGKQIIMTSDCPPRDLKGLQERLLSRFKWGLTADLQQPDYETRVAIIRKKMQEDEIDIPDNVVEYLAYSVDTNVRELEGVIISLIAHASLSKVEIDLELAKQILGNIVENIDSEVDIDFIQKTVSEFYHVKTTELKEKTIKKEIVLARQVAIYMSKHYTSHSLKFIGYHFGGRDHSTIIHSIQAVEDMMDVNEIFKSQIDQIKKKLKMKVL